MTAPFGYDARGAEPDHHRGGGPGRGRTRGRTPTPRPPTRRERRRSTRIRRRSPCRAGPTCRWSSPSPRDRRTPSSRPGTTETYRIQVTNQGPSTASGVSVEDALPAGLEASAIRVKSVTPAGRSRTATSPTRAATSARCRPGTVVELELDVDVPADFQVPAAGVVNSASVTSDTPDPSPDDNESSFTAGGPPSADISVRKTPPAESAGGRPQRQLRAGDRQLRSVGGTRSWWSPTCSRPGPASSGTSTRVVTPSRPGSARATAADPQELVTCDFGQFVDPIGGFPAFLGTRIGIEIAIDATTPSGTMLENTATAERRRTRSQPGQQHLDRRRLGADRGQPAAGEARRRDGRRGQSGPATGRRGTTIPSRCPPDTR